MGAFEDFWLDKVMFRGQTINQKYAHETIEQRRKRAARAFEMWRQGRIYINDQTGELRA